jgi:hypothetical protein
MYRLISLVFMALMLLAALPACSSRRYSSRTIPTYPISTPSPPSLEQSPLVGQPRPRPPGSSMPLYTSEEYRAKGDESLNDEEYFKALDYFAKSYQMDTSNQDTLVKAGVAMAKIGRPDLARKVFTKALAMNRSTPEATTAEVWLTRLNNPIKISILPDRPDTSRASIIPTHEVITKCLADSGLYEVVDYKKWGTGQEYNDMAEACQKANREGVKIIMSSETKYENRGSAVSGSSSYKAFCEIKLHIYNTKNGDLVKTLTKSVTWVMPKSQHKPELLGKRIGLLVKGLSMEVHKTLM